MKLDFKNSTQTTQIKALPNTPPIISTMVTKPNALLLLLYKAKKNLLMRRLLITNEAKKKTFSVGISNIIEKNPYR